MKICKKYYEPHRSCLTTKEKHSQAIRKHFLFLCDDKTGMIKKTQLLDVWQGCVGFKQNFGAPGTQMVQCIWFLLSSRMLKEWQKTKLMCLRCLVL